jgi:hypothetical protein
MSAPDTKPPGSSGKRETVYSDRFVPSRTASAGLREFSLLDAAVPPVSAAHPSSEREVRHLRNSSARALPRLSRVAARPPPRPGPSRVDAPSRPPVVRISSGANNAFFRFFREKCESGGENVAARRDRLPVDDPLTTSSPRLETLSVRRTNRKNHRTRPRRTPTCSATSF